MNILYAYHAFLSSLYTRETKEVGNAPLRVPHDGVGGTHRGASPTENVSVH